MSSTIFLLQDDGELVEMNARAYDNGHILQKLVADYPQLLVGDHINIDHEAIPSPMILPWTTISHAEG